MNSCVVVSQLGDESFDQLQSRLERRMAVVHSRQQCLDTAILLVGSAAPTEEAEREQIAALLAERLSERGQLVLIANEGPAEVNRDTLYALFDGLAARFHGSNKQLTMRFMPPHEPRSGVWNSNPLLAEQQDPEAEAC